MSWDDQLLSILNQQIACPFMDVLMVGLTLAAMPWPLLLALVSLPRRIRRQGIALLAGFVLSTLLTVGLQCVLARPRPAGVRLVLAMPAFPSFPSGHAAGTCAVATLTASFWPRARGPAFFMATLVSLSRIYLGHHYPSDVLGGAILGTATALVLYGLFCQPASHDRPRWAWLLWAQLAVVLLATLTASLGLLHFGLFALPAMDKILHFLLFGTLAFTAIGWWAHRSPWLVLGVLSLVTLAEEISQLLVPGRSPDVLDFLSSLSGIALFGWLGQAVASRNGSRPKRRFSPPPPERSTSRE